MAECNVCFRHCHIDEGKYGFCKVRTCRDGSIVPDNYGKVTSIALDPIEKKPLNRFFPGSMIVSVGSYGCNLRCPFCQNYGISWAEEVEKWPEKAKYISPEELCRIAVAEKPYGNIGVAFTYNEPLISYEYVLDTAKLLREHDLKTVLVTNGMADASAVGDLFGYVDAMNIDLKGFTDHYYEDLLKGNRRMVMDFIKEAVKHCHVEVTTLIIPGENDTDDEIFELSRWIRELTDNEGNQIGENIPLHLSRFFPKFHMTDRDATDVANVYHLKTVAEKNLKYVYTGNC
ncbi:pyruvate formate lyase activating enzyme [Oribacterium sp. KHPX15]|uniref:AmmeMemoRadiSam system radical SAM enzyme n=1 Tax=Oribacterium sp. KHPX15 TaxID=1855342 RepID=UPI0008988160|nr:AmmeMemoRadiSam system radical SAM enzyme [Oribacterium sp. KHPX15]SEA66145.1 pyruvate formate lyase activating enzyme [Oribacterium sp. KHPX15]